MRDIAGGKDVQVQAVARVVAAAAPDVLVVQGVDWDLRLRALFALRDAIDRAGWRFDHLFALRPNSGMASGLDMDGDGRLGEPEDAQGFGRFAGARGMAILSRFPVETETVRDFSALLWADLPGAILPPGMAPDVRAAQRLARVGHWVVPLRVAGARFHLMVFHATPPVFDGPEDRNGRRNHDELAFWQRYLDGAFGQPPAGRFALVGDANLDPADSDGRRAAIEALLADPRLQDPAPRRPGPVRPEPGQQGDPALDTASWPAPGPGNLRVSYVLPSAELKVTGSGVFWPPEDDPRADIAAAASRHRLVWVDIAIDW